MLENKVKMEFKAPKNKIDEYNGVEFEINPFLSLPQQAFLINQYVKEYFTNSSGLIGGSDYDYFGAECSLKNYILQGSTNIEVDNLDNDIYADFAFWEKIKYDIINYGDFRYKLDYIVKEVKEQIVLKNSLGTVVSDLIEKAYEMIEKINLSSPEEIKEMQESAQGLLKDQIGRAHV